ncbi:MAG TPA: M14 family metallopeptidase [Mariprofundaceae bacterium]|nr:M14 family metallopeptidase [Mariprofundaceae bacterium]
MSELIRLLQAFSADYAEARAKFLEAVAQAGLHAESHAHPGSGPNGEALATDSVWIGPADADNVLVLISATHGVEGFCGSGAEIDFLRNLPELPRDTAALVIHAINPHGFAWLRRVTMEGVDLNRNFVDFSVPLPENPGYDELADAIVPDSLSEVAILEADARLAAYFEKHGARDFEIALSGGQYRHPHGMFYGGTAPTWSRTTTEALVARHRLAERQRVALIDFHTGLGPFGYGEPICDHPPGSTGVTLAKQWYGDSVTEPALGSSTSVPKTGLADFGWQDLVGEPLVYVALEFGTYSFDEMKRVLRADHWLHAQGAVDWSSAETKRIKTAIRRQFYPDTDDWKEMVLFRSRQLIRQALNGMAS